jgi:hypothetical protein
MPTLEERRHQADMAMVHKITNNRDGLDRADGVKATHSTANPHNLRMRQGRMEIRRNFFIARVMETGTKFQTKS